jgi:hypothetical protein
MKAELVQDKKSKCWFPNSHNAWFAHKWVCNICKCSVIGAIPKLIGFNGEQTVNCPDFFYKDTGTSPDWVCCESDYDKVPIEHSCECAECLGI